MQLNERLDDGKPQTGAGTGVARMVETLEHPRLGAFSESRTRVLNEQRRAYWECLDLVDTKRLG